MTTRPQSAQIGAPNNPNTLNELDQMRIAILDLRAKWTALEIQFRHDKDGVLSATIGAKAEELSLQLKIFMSAFYGAHEHHNSRAFSPQPIDFSRVAFLDEVPSRQKRGARAVG